MNLRMPHVARVPHPPSPHTVIVILLLSSIARFLVCCAAGRVAVATTGVFAIESQHPLQSQAPSITVSRVGRVPAVVRIAYRVSLPLNWGFVSSQASMSSQRRKWSNISDTKNNNHNSNSNSNSNSEEKRRQVLVASVGRVEQKERNERRSSGVWTWAARVTMSDRVR